MSRQNVGMGAKRVAPRRLDTDVVANDRTVVERKKETAATPVKSPAEKKPAENRPAETRTVSYSPTGRATREALQNSWDLKVIALGALVGSVPATVTFFCLARGMHSTALVLAGVLFGLVLCTSQLLLNQFDALRDKLSIAREDAWFYVGLSLLGAPAGIGLGLWLG